MIQRRDGENAVPADISQLILRIENGQESWANVKRSLIILFVSLFQYCNFAIAQSPEDKAQFVLIENREFIMQAGKTFGVKSRLMVSVIYTEQVINVTWGDKELDIPLAKAGLNTSLGLGQMKVSTAEWFEHQMCDSASLYFLGDSIWKKFSHSRSRADLVDRLAIPKWNCYYVAGYLAMILKRWSDADVPLFHRVDIVATLYSAGVEKSGREIRSPHINPTPNNFGKFANAFYESDSLLSIFPR
jgi:hypothetical protein